MSSARRIPGACDNAAMIGKRRATGRRASETRMKARGAGLRFQALQLCMSEWRMRRASIAGASGIAVRCGPQKLRASLGAQRNNWVPIQNGTRRCLGLRSASASRMTIRILTSHPALRYVLERSAPMGTTVRAPVVRRRTNQEVVYAIDIESRLSAWDECREVLCSWIPAYVMHYGAHRVEIDGRPVRADEAQMRLALSGGIRQPTGA